MAKKRKKVDKVFINKTNEKKDLSKYGTLHFLLFMIMNIDYFNLNHSVKLKLSLISSKVKVETGLSNNIF